MFIEKGSWITLEGKRIDGLKLAVARAFYGDEE